MGFWETFNLSTVFKQTRNAVIGGARPVNKNTYSPAFSEDDPAPLAVDKDSGRLLVDVAGLSSAGTLSCVQYLAGDAEAFPTGTVILGKDNTDTLRALVLTTGGVLQVQQADLDSDVDEVSTFEGSISKRIDEASATVTYIGEAVIGSAEGASVWRIRKIDFNNPTSIKWANGSAFDQIWTNRAALTYT